MIILSIEVNCPDCGGEGKAKGRRCPQCNGTGGTRDAIIVRRILSTEGEEEPAPEKVE